MKGRSIYGLFLGLMLLCSSAYASDITVLGSISTAKKIDAVALAPNTGVAYGISSSEKSVYIFDLVDYIQKTKVKLGNRTPKGLAVDATSGYAYVTSSETAKKGLLFVIDSSGKTIASTKLSEDPQGVAIDDANNTAVIAMEKGKKLTVVSTSTYSVLYDISLSKRPRAVAVDTGLNRALVTAGKAEGEGKQNHLLIVDLDTGHTLNDIELKHEIKSVAVDSSSGRAVTVSEDEVTVIDVNTGLTLLTIEAEDAEAVAVNKATHTAIVTKEDDVLIVDLEALTYSKYGLHKSDLESLAADQYRNTALIAAEKYIYDAQLPNPVPVITSIEPKSVRSGDGAFTLKVGGEKFLTTSTVKFNSTSIDTTFKGNTELEADVTSSMLATPGTAPVVVNNPAPSGGDSNSMDFTIKYPTPEITSVAPDTANAKSPDFSISVKGNNFLNGYVVNFNGQDLATTYKSSTELTAVVPASLVQTKGTYQVVVISTDRQNSNVMYFIITDASTFTITISSGSNGSIGCAPNPANSGSSSICTITPSTGFSITDVSVDNLSQGPITSYTFNNISADHTISASFADITPPTLSSVHVDSTNADPSYAKVGDTVTVSLTASEPINQPGISIVGYAAAVSGSGTTWIGTYIMNTSAAEGVIGISVSFSDLAGNSGSITTSTTDATVVTFDATPPSLSISSLSDGSYTNNAVLNISGMVSDNMAMSGITVNGEAVVITDGSFSHALSLVAGANTLTTAAYDKAGNTSTDLRTVMLDMTFPIITIMTPADNSATNSQIINVSGTVDETAAVTVKLNGGDGVPASISGNNFSLDVALVADAQNTIEVYAVDRAGNTVTSKRTVMQDDTRPALSITEPSQDISTNQAFVEMKGEVSDLNLAGVTITDGLTMYAPAVSDGSFSQFLNFSLEKTHSFTVTAYDIAGNTTSVIRNIIYDVTAPSLTLNPVTKPTKLSSQTISGTVESGATVGITGKTLTVGSVSYPNSTSWQAELMNMTEGDNPFTVTATDAAGNATTIEGLITYDIRSTVTAVAYANGSISPSGKILVAYNAVQSFTITPNTGYKISSVTGCGGTLSGSSFTTAAIQNDCTVTATFEVDYSPKISGFSPTSGQSGTVVTITGGNLSNTPTYVYFNGSQATTSGISQTQITAVVPSGATTGPVKITTTAGEITSSTNFTVTSRQDFSLSASPASLSIPSTGSASSLVTLNSTGSETFTGLVKLAVSNLPSGISVIFNPEYVSAGKSTTLTIAASGISSEAVLTVSGSATVENAEISRTADVSVSPVPAGTTTLSGTILAAKDAQPIANVTVSIGSLSALTDASGGFMFIDPPTGEQVLIIDGHTGNTVTATYPSSIPVAVTVTGGMDNTLPYQVYLHEVNTSYYTVIDPSRDTVVTDPDLSNFELLIPAGVVITGHDGVANEKVSVKKIATDRLPIAPPPQGVYATEIYMYYFFKPGGGTPSQPISVKMPNTMQASPGDRVTLYYYDESQTPDSNSNQWKSFGEGTVSDDGRTINPDAGVGIPKFCCGASYPSPQTPNTTTTTPPDNNDPCGGVGDPVDPFSGAYTYSETDLGYPAPSMLRVTRSYNSNTTSYGPFGYGTSLNYNVFLTGSGDALTYNTAEGGKYIFSRNDDGSYTNEAYPFLKGAKAYLHSDNSRTLVMKDGATFTFNSGGSLIKQTDINGNYVSITRDGLGYVSGLADNLGNSISITTTSVTVGRSVYTIFSSIHDAYGRTVQYAYDSKGKLTSVTNPEGGVTTFAYDSASSKIISVTLPSGTKLVENEYSASGRVTSQIHADGAKYSFIYNVSGGLCSLSVNGMSNCDIDPPDENQWRGSLCEGNMGVCSPIVPSTPLGGTVTSVAVRDPNGNKITYRLNGNGYTTDKTDAYGQVTTYERDASSNALLSVTDPLARKTSYTYDDNGNTTSITDPVGNMTTYEYDLTLNKPTKITDALGNATAMTYDDKGNLTQITKPGGEITAISYNTYGQPIAITDALNNTTTIEYDSYGRMSKITDPLGNASTMAYDLISRLTSSTNPMGKTSSYTYDDMNRIKETIDQLGNTTKYEYDLNGNLTKVTDAKNQTISYTYNVRDKAASMTDQLGKTETYTYDGNDNLTSVTDRKGQTTTYAYDKMNRISKAQYADGSSTIYSYDAVGRLTYINDSQSGVIQYGYSNTGCSSGCKTGFTDRVMQEITTLGSISYEYDALGRRTKMTVAGQPEVDYSYDVNGRLLSIVGAGLNPTQFVYDALGRRTSMTLPNGVTTNYTYDNASRLLNIEHLDPIKAILEQIGYEYDVNGNRTKMDRMKITPKLPSPASNITYNSANQMLTYNGYPMSYDNNGNLISKGSSDGTTTYAWNSRNQLTAINGPSLMASFKYDALGRRIEKTVNNKTIGYLYDGLDIVQEIENGAVSANYLRTLRIDEPLARIKTDGTTRYYQADALGSIIALTDETGNIKTQYNYDPFGNTEVTDETSDNPLQYTGRENDGTGLYYYRARYYSPELQRFISEDPIGLKGGPNFYAYVGNEPISKVDPKGLAVAPSGNGNVWPSFHEQDMKCSVAFVGSTMDCNRCIRRCCQMHDLCYAVFGCNYSSWGNTSKIQSCQICNYFVVSCVITCN